MEELNAGSIDARLRAVEANLAIQQLAVRYALAVDARDLDLMAEQWVPDAWMGRAHGAGPDGVRSFFEPVLRTFYRSIHMIAGHRIDLVDDDHATGQVICRAEHEINRRWVVQAIVYDDVYRRVEGRWGFVTRVHRHWYSAPVDESPRGPDFEHWPTRAPGPPPDLPHVWGSWERFWQRAGVEATAAVTDHPGAASTSTSAAPDAVAALSVRDRLEIHQLAIRYANAIDAADLDGLASVFTADARFVMVGFGEEPTVANGWPEIRQMMDAARHPVAHHVVNVEIVAVDRDEVRLHSVIAGTGRRGRVGSADYDDRLVRTDGSWRIAQRVVTLRRADA